MLGQIIFTITAFLLFVYIVLLKLIKKNDTTYLIILTIQTIGITLNFIKISYNILNGAIWNIILYLLCIITPIIVCILEYKKINVSELLKIVEVKICILINKPEIAKGILENLVKIHKGSYIGHKMLGNIYETERDNRKAIDEYVQALETKKNDYNTYYKISTLLYNLNQKQEATEMLKNLLNKKPAMYEASKLLGKIYIEQKEFKKAIEIYANATKYLPESYETYYNLGICYARINDFDISRQCFQKSVEINNANYLAYYRLGQIALLYRDFESAEENFAKSLHNEKEAKAYFELAKIHMMKNEKEKATTDITNLLKVDSTYYKKVKTEPIFYPIKQSIEKPKIETIPEYIETKEEKEIEEYLNKTYNLTKVLNDKKDIIKK